jgi:hypothetical protein
MLCQSVHIIRQETIPRNFLKWWNDIRHELYLSAVTQVLNGNMVVKRTRNVGDVSITRVFSRRSVADLPIGSTRKPTTILALGCR